ncbi:MAG: hypothetical protein AAB834_02355 [Patescibacteria group bacterium]
MKRFMLLYKGPATTPDATHEGWPEWFASAGESLVDRGSPMNNGLTVHGDGTSDASATGLNGYSIIQAENTDEARDLVASHPYLSGSGCTVEIFEIPNK